MEDVLRRILLCLPQRAAGADPDPTETAKRNVVLVGVHDGQPAGVVGFAEGGWAALELAARHGDLVDRLVLVSTPPLESDPPEIAAKTLLLYGAKDSEGGYAHGKWWRDRLGARLEMVADGGHDILERVWPRVLSHLAPRTLRK